MNLFLNIDFDKTLIQAIKEHDINTIKQLVNNKINLNPEVGNLQSGTLTLAASFGNLSIVQYLFENGAKLTPFSNNDFVLDTFTASIFSGKIEVVAYLYQKITSPLDSLCLFKALKIATLNEFVDIFKYLITLGADIHFDNEYLLNEACKKGNLDMVKLLVENGAKVHFYKPLPDKILETLIPIQPGLVYEQFPIIKTTIIHKQLSILQYFVEEQKLKPDFIINCPHTDNDMKAFFLKYKQAKELNDVLNKDLTSQYTESKKLKL